MKEAGHSSGTTCRVLVIKLSSLGDLFHALPVVHLLKKHLHAEVDWVTQPEYAALVGAFPEVSRVIPFPRRALWSQGRAYFERVRSMRYDYIVDLQGLLKSAVAARMARGGLRIGPSYQREGARFLYHRVAGPRNKNRHAVEEALDVVRHLQLPVDEVAFPCAFPEVALAGAEPRVALLPASRWATKNAPPALFVGLGRRLLERGAGSLVLAGAPGDAPVCEAIEREIQDPRVINLCGKTTLCELGGVLQQMKLVVTVDSGPMHMAAALGVRVVALFGATDPARTGPYGAGHLVLTEPGLSCRPCLSRTCQRGDLACLARMTPDAVLAAMEQAGLLFTS